ncbi:hypothetical protein AEM42_13230 [Betaproteobacteria bacterium UKL13-2]|jgi:hypothetical protein|nr:hypothetical protein AEM42_13230 [Betaproteobacteria bacterium UKL13-2]
MRQIEISKLAKELVGIAEYARMEGLPLIIAGESWRSTSISAPEFELLKRELTVAVPDVKLLYTVR